MQNTVKKCPKQVESLKEFNDICDLITPYGISTIIDNLYKYLADRLLDGDTNIDYKSIESELSRFNTNQILLLDMLNPNVTNESKIKSLSIAKYGIRKEGLDDRS